MDLGLLVDQPPGGPHLAHVPAVSLGGGDHQHPRRGCRRAPASTRAARPAGRPHRRPPRSARDPAAPPARTRPSHRRSPPPPGWPCRPGPAGPYTRGLRPSSRCGRVRDRSMSAANHGLACRRGLGHHRACGGRRSGSRPAPSRASAGTPSALANSAARPVGSSEPHLVGRRHPHPVLRGPHRNVQAGLVTGEGELRLLHSSRAPVTARARGRLEGHAVHARVQPDRPECGAGPPRWTPPPALRWARSLPMSICFVGG